ncbi:MAG TPA: hypothetical protein VK573_08935 [Gemmatimonadales bacterium]|nr:hypothetical protein [Gemmatimonadales bacterium]
MKFGDAVRFLNGLPGIILAGLAALVAFNAYVAKREELAVARAEWRQERDRIRNQIVAESLAADTRERVRQDSITRLTTRLTAAVTSAASAGRSVAVFHQTLHELVDSNAAAKAALDSLEAHQATQVMSLKRAVAISDSLLRIERDRVADRDAQLRDLRANLVTAITRADNFERQAHPGAIKRVLDSPVTHLVAAGIGYTLGAK